MTVDDATHTDLKAGFTGMCRGGSHRQCQTAKAICSCPCHGRRGQSQDAPTATVTVLSVGRPLMSVPDVQEDAPVNDYTCPTAGCDRSFGTEHALKIHAGRAHNHPAAQPKPVKERKPRTPPRPAAPTKPVAVGERRALAVIARAYAELCGADVYTSIDSAATILDAITADGLVLIEVP